MQDQQPQWNYQPDTDGPAQQPSVVGEEVRWRAPQYQHHDKGAGWYVTLLIAAAGIGALAYLIAQDRWAVIAIAALAVVVAIAGGRKPSEVEYAVSNQGIEVGQRAFRFSDFRSFSIVQDSAGRSIIVSPVKRFTPPVTLLYGSEQEPKIVEILGSVLPHEDHQPDSIDRLTRRLRF